MKTLYLVRHAKAEKDLDDYLDIERPLAHRGVVDSNHIAQVLAKKNEIPELILTSPGVRAISTALTFARHFDFPWEKFLVKDGIYEADMRSLVNVLKATPNNFNKVMMFGHNPGFTDLANALIDEKTENIPTCGVVRIQYNNLNSWADIDKTKGTLSFFLSPKNSVEHE